MKRSIAQQLLTLFLVAGFCRAAEHRPAPKTYENGKIIDIQRKVNTKILYYMVNTPITKDEPYYEISVQLKDGTYIGRYTPRHADEELPEDWTNGADVKARVDGHHLYLQRPSRTDMDLLVIKHTMVTTEEPATSQKPPAKN